MKLDIIALVSVLSAAVAILLSVINYFAFFKVDKRTKKAEARKKEIEGDQASLDYLTDLKDEITKELKERIDKLEARIKTLEGEREDHLGVIDKLKEAGKECHSCTHNTIKSPCPAIVKYKELTR